jgi:hypothetical protein
MFASSKSGSGTPPQTPDPYYEYVTMLLNGDGTNGSQNNTFLDSSTNNYSLARNGNTTQGTLSPFGSNWGNYFNGSADFLTFSGTNPGSGNFTIEAWVFIEAPSTLQASIFYNDSSSYLEVFAVNTTDQNNFYALMGSNGTANGGNSGFYSTGSFSPNTWTHLAYVRNSGVITIYINGVAGGTLTNSHTFRGLSRIGVARYADSNNYYPFKGTISNLHVTNTAVYTSGFTPATTPLTAISGTSLLTCQSNRFIDNSTNNFTLTLNGTPLVQQFSPFNPTASYTSATIAGSGYFDGSGDYLTTSSSQVIPTGSFTLEAWVYTTSANSVNKNIISQGSAGNSGRTALSIESSAWWFQIGGDYVNNGTPILGQWNYVAMTFNGSTIEGYVNGVSQGSVARSGNAQNTTLSIGREWLGQVWNGYISSVRISNTVRTVTSIPTSPFSSDGNTVFLANFTNAGIPDYSMRNNLETIGNAQVSTTQSKFGTGSMYFDGTGDGLVVASSPLAVFGTKDFTIEWWQYWNSISGFQTIYSNNYVSSNNILIQTGDGTGKYRIFMNDSNPTLTETDAASTGQWYHYAVVRNGSTLTIYRNGVSNGSTTSSASVGVSTAITEIGQGNNSFSLNSYIDDLRITRGYARYTSTFTPPTTAFPTF